MIQKKFNQRRISRRKFILSSAMAGSATALLENNFSAVTGIFVSANDDPGTERSGTGEFTELIHSDIVRSWTNADPEIYNRYGVTAWGWGTRDSELICDAYSRGYRLVASIVNLIIRPSHKKEHGRDLYYNPALRSTTCKDIAGEEIVVPWFALEYGDGNRAYWHCTNQPLYREHLKRLARSGVLAGANAINIDDAMGNAMVLRLKKTGGCFCDACMEGFRDYLERQYSADELLQKGVESIEDFDYRNLVRNVATTRETFGDGFARGIIPLQEDFLLFQTRSAADFLGELIGAARETAGYEIPVSANLAGLFPEYLLGASHVDYFIIELAYIIQPGNFPLEALKVAQSMNKKCATWPGGFAVEHVRKNKQSGLVKLWIATTYALGHNFMIPVKMWCSTDGINMVYYSPPEDEVLPLYEFIRKYARYFDGFEESPDVAVLYNNRLRRQGNVQSIMAGWELFKRNIPYELLLAGDEYLDARLNEKEGGKYELILVPDENAVLGLDTEQRGIVERWLKSGKAKYMEEFSQNPFPSPVRILNNRNIRAILRRNDLDGNQVIAIHLVDHNYDEGTNTFGERPRVELEIDKGIFKGSVMNTAMLLSPGAEPKEVTIENRLSSCRFSFEMTDIWNILIVN